MEADSTYWVSLLTMTAQLDEDLMTYNELWAAAGTPFAVLEFLPATYSALLKAS